MPCRRLSCTLRTTVTTLALLGAVLAVSCVTVPAPPSADVAAADRIDALIAQMTLEEKVGQLSLYAAAGSGDDLNPDSNRQSREQQLAEIRAGRVTGLFNGVGAAWTRELQRVAVEQSRLHIPLLFGADVIHGFRTVFPVPLAEAASWEPALARRTARVAAIEATAAGLQWNFAPMVDISRDARWGRAVEGAGEDVYLARRFAAARVHGFQGDDLAAPDTLAATLKHFAAYGAAEAGLDYNTVDISERSLRDTYLPPFQSALAAGAATVMTAFNEIAGVPSSANPDLLDGILRREWGFAGPVVSDYTSEAELVTHGFAANEREATWLAFLAGVDISMQSGIYMKYLPGLVRDGAVPPARLDQAVRRVLMLKQRLGLFDDPYRGVDSAREAANTATPAHRALAREAARRSIVLLSNHDDLLPLPKHGRRLALIGPFGTAQHDINGPWTLFASDANSVSLEQGLRAALGDPALLTVVKGSEVDAPIDGGIEAAVAAAREADVVLLAIGESARYSGEAKSRTEIVVPPAQQALAEAVAATGKPVVVLLRNGRPLVLRGAVRAADAILVTWFLGSESGNAIADVLFGDYSPSGHLPVSFPQAPGQVPYYYSRKNTGRAALNAQAEYQTRFLDLSNEAAFPFGHGLSYSRLAYGEPEPDRAQLPWDGTLTVRTRITNTGTREAEEVVQLYVRDRVASVTRPVRELKGFEKVRLAPGQSVQVSFALRRADLEFIGRDLKPVAEPGVFDVWVAADATGGRSKSFELMPP